MTREEALRYRGAIELAAQSLPDETALTVVSLHPKWQSGTAYPVGHKVRYGDQLYRCLTEHTAQPLWMPPDSPSLWARVLTGEDGEILPWEQPDSTNPYRKGDKVTHKGKTWVSDVDGNVWEPGVYGWTEVST